ncbi:unnamed protein product [Ectocarpus sp. CCAP 1310/34]|nr:unnamed protein product [Ectocarpus sp. CCAP 1310/34]
MPKGTGERKGGGAAVEEQEQKLQAILLADSFNTNFRPISSDMPKVLCPLVNVPMIDYTMEFLARNDVREVFVFCVSHAKQLEEYLQSSTWAAHMEVRIITSNNCLSAGDALRDIDQRGVVRSDPFVLVSGDVVSNIDLKSVIKQHKETKKADPLTLMTMCFKEVGAVSSARPILDSLVIGMSKATQQIVLFQNNMEEACLDVNPIFLEEHGELQLRSDLLDCHVDVCSPEVLVQLSDNFDYQDIRQHFVAYEAANHELGNKILAHVVPDAGASFAVRVHDFRLYHEVCRDVILRWMYPLVPDNATTGGVQTQYTYSRVCNYKAPGVNLPRSVRLGNGVVIGADVTVGENTVIERSVIGDGCRIGQGVTLVDSYMWAGSEVGDGARVEGAIVASRAMAKTPAARGGAIVRAGAVVPRGCVLGPDTIVGEGVHLAEFTRVTSGRADDEDDDDWGDDGRENSDEGVAPKGGSDGGGLLGPDGVGRVWAAEDKQDSDWEDDHSMDSAKEAVDVDKVRCESIGCVEEEAWKRNRWTEFRDEEDDLLDDRDLSDDESGGLQVMAAMDGSEAFHQVVKDMLLNGHQEGHPLDNLLLEIKSYKFAQNREFKECMRPAVELVLDLAGADTGNGMALVAAVKTQLRHWKPLLSKLNVEAGDDVEMIKVVESYALRPECEGTLRAVFRYVVQSFFQEEMVSEDCLERWIQLRRATPQGSPERGLFEQKEVQAFVAWLEDSESSSGEEDGDSDDEESTEEDE